MGLLTILKTVGLNVLMAFFGEKLIGKLVFGLLAKLAASTKNGLDDEIVADAKKRFMEKY
ncbi:hypothetical protein [Vibrio sp. SCSIO 43137]|uniref:hypothetical protein n=1 Tax=Vibrio sp. SCSIO 43137 TaxID=3021011 RepID=UPI002307071E|nr:hypothetical protein [Vibrio sp. SCSIO 43137]WCE28413.1 hypothetical protein PK654_08475 [Vibrio sp. SCSIO 43137]